MTHVQLSSPGSHFWNKNVPGLCFLEVFSIVVLTDLNTPISLSFFDDPVIARFFSQEVFSLPIEPGFLLMGMALLLGISKS
jgi:hypothetical protein